MEVCGAELFKEMILDGQAKVVDTETAFFPQLSPFNQFLGVLEVPFQPTNLNTQLLILKSPPRAPVTMS